MKLLRCSREAELKEEMESGHWPEASSSELRGHVAVCSGCLDAVLLRQSFRAARTESVSAAQLPPPGMLWWRAQLRRRNAALAKVQRPIVGAQIFALLVTVAIGCGLAIVEWRTGLEGGLSVSGWLDSLNSLPKSSAAHLEGLFSTASSVLSGNLVFLTPALVVLALVGGLAALMVTDKS